MNTGIANDNTYDTLAKIRHSHLKEFPGLDALGLSNNTYDKKIAHGIMLAITASERYPEDGENSYHYGALAMMFLYGIINIDDLEIAIRKASPKSPAVPMHDAY